jgi:hypothetical protein
MNAGIADVIHTPMIVRGTWMNSVDPLVIGLPLSIIALVAAWLILSWKKDTVAETETL